MANSTNNLIFLQNLDKCEQVVESRLSAFFKDVYKNVLFIESQETWPVTSMILRLLMKLKKLEKSKQETSRYLQPTNQTFLNWSQLCQMAEVYEHCDNTTDLLVVEARDTKLYKNKESEGVLKKLMDELELAVTKKVLLIVPKCSITDNGAKKAAEQGETLSISNLEKISPMMDVIEVGLYAASSAGNITCVRSLITSGIDVNRRDGPNEETALHGAARNGHIDIVSLLIASGAYLDSVDSIGSTPLHLATQYNQFAIVKTLLDNGANVNAQNSEDKSALHIAVERGDKRLILLMLRFDADKHSRDQNGNTPLHLAALFGHKDIIMALLKNNVDVNLTNDEGKSSIYLAVERNNSVGVVKLFTDNGANLKLRDNRERNLLHCASENGNENLVRFFLNRGLPRDAVDMDGIHYVHLAALSGSQAVIDVCKSKHMNLGVKTRSGKTALHYAAENGHKELVSSLLEMGIDDGTSESQPLLLAARNGHKEIVELFINNGIDINYKTKENYTILHAAAESGNTELVEWLIRNNADLKAENIYGYNAMHFAALGGHRTVIEMLERHGLEVFPKNNSLGNTGVLRCAVEEGRNDLISWLFQRDASNSKDDVELLPIAAKNGHSTTVQLLVKKGLNIKFIDPNGCTILHNAALNDNNSDLIQWLLKNGIDINSRTHCGESALHWAVKSGCKCVTKTLLECGINRHLENMNSLTALHLAKQLLLDEISQIFDDQPEQNKIA